MKSNSNSATAACVSRWPRRRLVLFWTVLLAIGYLMGLYGLILIAEYFAGISTLADALALPWKYLLRYSVLFAGSFLLFCSFLLICFLLKKRKTALTRFRRHEILKTVRGGGVAQPAPSSEQETNV